MKISRDNLENYLKHRLPIIGSWAALAFTCQISDQENDYLEKTVSSESKPDYRETAINPLPIEQLREEYAKLEELKDINRQIGSTRRQIKQLLKFLWRAGPNLAKNRLFNNENNFTFQELTELGIPLDNFTPLVDLGSFDLPKLQKSELELDQLKQLGIKEIVLMEDRDPQFFLNYDDYQADQTVPLNRHGSPEQEWNMADLKKLAEELHRHQIKLIIGFWGNTGKQDRNPFLKRNWQTLEPVIPSSDDINPLSLVRDRNWREMPFADYVLRQYRKIKEDFGVDGLFLGDGLMGFRSFLDAEGPYQAEKYAYLWTDFYKRIYQGLKKIDPQDTLWAYDCLGRGRTAALANGLHLDQIANYLDHYVFQGYGADAWGADFMNLEGYTGQRDQSHLASLPDQLKAKTKYTVGLGDQVEGWQGNRESIRRKHQALAPDARQGTLGVWSTALFKKDL